MDGGDEAVGGALTGCHRRRLAGAKKQGVSLPVESVARKMQAAPGRDLAVHSLTLAATSIDHTLSRRSYERERVDSNVPIVNYPPPAAAAKYNAAYRAPRSDDNNQSVPPRGRENMTR